MNLPSKTNTLAMLVASLAFTGSACAGVSMDGTGPGRDRLTANTADTLVVDPGGVGHIQIVPYFTTQAGNVTLLAITNNDQTNGKAVKVRFRSAANGDDVFDFTVMLAPADVWTASISQGPGGISRLATADKSCTLPTLVNGSFSTDMLPPVTSTFTADALASWTREGSIEIINSADILPTSNVSGKVGDVNPLFTAIKQIAGVPPCTAAVLQKLAIDPVLEADAVEQGLDTPSGGLSAWSTIYNAQNAFISWTVEPTAISAVVGATGKAANARLVFSPQTSEVATPAVAASLTADPLVSVSRQTARQFQFPDLSTPLTTNASPIGQANRLAQAMAIAKVSNDYTTLASIGSRTDFVFSQPVRRYMVGFDYQVPVETGLVFNFNSFYSRSNTSRSGLQSCNVLVNPGDNASFDRETTAIRDGEFSIATGFIETPPKLCGSASVISFNNPAPGPSALNAMVARVDITAVGIEGWARFLTPALGQGLPLLGAAYVSARGPVVSGTSTNFGWSVKHRTTAFRP